MDVKARCGCGAELELTPRDAPYGHSDYSTRKDEREAVAAAFREWVGAHTECRRPNFTMPPRWFQPNGEPPPGQPDDVLQTVVVPK